MAETVVALYDDHDDAEKAVRKLVDNGIDRRRISVVKSDPDGRYENMKVDEKGNMVGEGAATGATTGAVIGGIIGFLISGGTLALPMAGLVFVGPIAGILGGAGIGALAGGMVGALIGLGIPKEHADTYAEAVRRGGVLVAVDAAGASTNKVSGILDDFNPVDITEREEHYRREGWTGYDPKAKPLTADEMERERSRYRTETTSGRRPEHESMGQRDKIDVVKEDVSIGKREVERGGARIRTYVHERPIEEDIQLREEHVNVERKPVDRPAGKHELDAFQEGTVEVREKREEPVVQKEARVVEEVSINKTADTRTEHVRETAREMHVDVEEIDRRHGKDFRNDYDQRYGQAGGNYDSYRPAYEFGAHAAQDERYQGRDWNGVENDLKSQWERTNPGTWNTYRDAIHTGWDQAKSHVTHGRATAR
jgi:stress response protein YsnF/uncharacterized membrane protein